MGAGIDRSSGAAAGGDGYGGTPAGRGLLVPPQHPGGLLGTEGPRWAGQLDTVADSLVWLLLAGDDILKRAGAGGRSGRGSGTGHIGQVRVSPEAGGIRGLRTRRRVRLLLEPALDHLQWQKGVSLLAQDPPEALEIRVVELAVAGRRPLRVDQALAFQEPDLGDGDIGELFLEQ
jgi:hypothetical protein